MYCKDKLQSHLMGSQVGKPADEKKGKIDGEYEAVELLIRHHFSSEVYQEIWTIAKQIEKACAKRRGHLFTAVLFMHSHGKIKTKWPYYSTGTGLTEDDGGLPVIMCRRKVKTRQAN